MVMGLLHVTPKFVFESCVTNTCDHVASLLWSRFRSSPLPYIHTLYLWVSLVTSQFTPKTSIVLENVILTCIFLSLSVDTFGRRVHHSFGSEASGIRDFASVLSAQPVPITSSPAELLQLPKDQPGTQRVDLQTQTFSSRSPRGSSPS